MEAWVSRVFEKAQSEWHASAVPRTAPSLASLQRRRARAYAKPWMTRCDGFHVLRLTPMISSTLCPGHGIHDLQGCAMLRGDVCLLAGRLAMRPHHILLTAFAAAGAATQVVGAIDFVSPVTPRYAASAKAPRPPGLPITDAQGVTHYQRVVSVTARSSTYIHAAAHDPHLLTVPIPLEALPPAGSTSLHCASTAAAPTACTFTARLVVWVAFPNAAHTRLWQFYTSPRSHIREAFLTTCQPHGMLPAILEDEAAWLAFLQHGQDDLAQLLDDELSSDDEGSSSSSESRGASDPTHHDGLVQALYESD